MIPEELINTEAEQALLGSLLIRDSLFSDLNLSPDIFYLDRHKMIFKAMYRVIRADKPLDILLLSDELGPLLDDVGGSAYLTQLLNWTPSAVHAPYYVELLHELALRRQLFDLAGKLARSSGNKNSGLLDVGFIMNDIESAIKQVHKSMFVHRSIEQLSDELPPTSWLWPGYIPYQEISAIGGREGTGKTAIIHDWIRRILNGHPMPDGVMPNLSSDKVLFLDAEDFSIGMAERTNWWKASDEPNFWHRQDGFEIVPYPSKDLLDLALPHQQEAIEEIIREIRPCLFVVDSWQSSMLKSTFDEQVAHVIQWLKNIAKRYFMAVLVTMQMNKDEGDPYRKPTSTAFKGAGSAAYRFRATYSAYRMQLGGVKDMTKDARIIEAFRVSSASHPKPIVCTFEPLHPKGFFVKYHNPDDLLSLRMEQEVDDDLEVQPMTSLEQAQSFVRSTLFIRGALSYLELKDLAVEEAIGVRSLAEAVKTLKSAGEVMNTLGERKKGNKICLAEGFLDGLK